MQHYCIIPDTLKGTLPDNGIQAYTTHHPHHQASLSYDKATMHFEKKKGIYWTILAIVIKSVKHYIKNPKHQALMIVMAVSRRNQY